MVFSFVVTVADYADADPAIVKSGRVKKAVANAVEKEGKRSTLTSVFWSCLLDVIKYLIYHCVCPVKLLCGLEASQGAVEEVLSSAVSIRTDSLDSSDDLDPEEDEENETKVVCKKKNKRRKGIICKFFFSIFLN